MEDRVHVSHYRSLWNYATGRGAITLILADGREHLLDSLDATAFFALNDMLRNERPVMWSQSAHAVFTLGEMIGEGEMGR